LFVNSAVAFVILLSVISSYQRRVLERVAGLLHIYWR